jgi:hypothetical protein
MATILSRLTLGFFSIIDRFTRGKSTAADYQTLLSLSDLTRSETLRTFDQLSNRLSTSSLALVTASTSLANRGDSRNQRDVKGPSRGGERGHKRAKSTPDLSVTPLGPAGPSGVSGVFIGFVSVYN